MVRAPQIATRLSCFAIISAIEDDLREEATAWVASIPSMSLLPPDVREKAAKRQEENAKDLPQIEVTVSDDAELLPYTDFGDLASILRLGVKPRGVDNKASVIALAAQLEKLVPCRNRVCHSRPLEPEDYPSLLDFAQALSQSTSPFGMTRCKAAVAQLLQDPTFVSQLAIPAFWSVDVSEVQHNLPLPEFDDTGFLGRAKDRREVAKLLSSPHPVVTIVGEGGVGKTALAMRCLYDIVEKPEVAEFDAIIWISLKSQVLTGGGVKEIRGAITDVLGVVRDVADELGVPGANETSNIEVLIHEIASYMGEFRILLAIDNVETLAKETLRPLLSAIPRKSKVLLTSRIGLGEIELRYPLDPLDQATAVALMRRLASHLNVSLISKLSEEPARQLCNAVFNNPLLIKWFVSAVAGGLEPQSILSRNSPSFLNAVSFCFENLFNRLTDDEKHLVYILASARKPLSQAELFYLAKGMPKDQLEWALSTLLYSSILRRSFNTERSQSSSTYYALTEIASEYVSKITPPPSDIFKMVQASLRELHVMVQSDLVAQATYPLQIFAIHAKSRDEIICAAYLKKALNAVRGKDCDAALNYVEEAKAILPSYAENYRVAAIVKSSRDDTYQANEEYKLALELAPESPIINYTYGQFLLRLDDASQAFERFKETARLVPNDVAPLTLMALSLTRLGEYKEASELYEKVLPQCDRQPKKWRLSTRDQAAECYRRWMEQDRLMRDNGPLRAHLVRSLEILNDAFTTGDYDAKTMERLEKVLDEGIPSAIEFSDEEGANIIAQTVRQTWMAIERSDVSKRLIERLRQAFPSIHLEDFESLSEISRQFFKDWASKMEKSVVIPIKRREWKQNEEVTGEIKSIVSSKGYGFITSTDGSDWFFHRSDVQPTLPWNSLSVGTHVRFCVGQNKGGRCAINIRAA